LREAQPRSAEHCSASPTAPARPQGNPGLRPASLRGVPVCHGCKACCPYPGARVCDPQQCPNARKCSIFKVIRQKNAVFLFIFDLSNKPYSTGEPPPHPRPRRHASRLRCVYLYIASQHLHNSLQPSSPYFCGKFRKVAQATRLYRSATRRPKWANPPAIPTLLRSTDHPIPTGLCPSAWGWPSPAYPRKNVFSSPTLSSVARRALSEHLPSRKT
jgi:hypothetical protein